MAFDQLVVPSSVLLGRTLATPQPTLLLNAAKVVDLIVLGSAVAVLGHRWGRRRNAPTGWAL
ncbi:MAG: hypothetical protein M3N21_08935, partial [Actinomycetota bacterium]|nr:hypothetical protein [Actinomycetota bacterium]